MLRKPISFFTTKCPICRFRYGARVAHRQENLFLKLLFVRLFECHACNRRFHAFQVNGFHKKRTETPATTHRSGNPTLSV